MPLPVFISFVVSTSPSSSATITDAVLKTDPGSSKSLTALFFTSRYCPSAQRVMFTIAFMSPVGTSITIATPTCPLISFSSSITARSAMSCICTSIVVTMSEPSMASFCISPMKRRFTFCFCIFPDSPRRTESNDSSSPKRAESLAP